MEYNKFEQHLKESFNKQEEAVDVSKIMAGVIASEKKSYKALYITFALLFAITASTSYVLYSNSSLDSNQINQNEISDHNNSSFTSLDINKFESAVKELDENDKNSEVKLQDKKIVAISDNLVNVSKPKDSNSDQEQINQINTSNSQSTSMNEERFVTFENSTFNYNTSQSESIGKIDKESVNNITFEPSYSQNTPLEISFLTTLEAEKLYKTNRFKSLTFPDLVECPKFNKNPWIYEIGTIMGVSNPVKRFSINPEEINPALTSRAENEKSLEGLDLEFYLSAKRTRWPVFVKSGLAYSRWTEQMNLERKYTEVDTVQGIISATVSQNGDTLTYIYGDIFIEKDIEIKKKVHYYINRVSVPISLVYEKEFGKNNAFQAELGASFNISTFSVGSLYESEDTFTNVNVGEFFKTLTGVSYFSKLHYRRYVTNHAFIGTLGHFHYLPSEFSTQSSFSQKYINYGLSVYAGYRF